MPEDQLEDSKQDIMDFEDYKALLHKILRQAIDDYIKLQHPKFRNKAYLQEAFEHAVDMIFDSEYRFLYLKNELGEDMSLKDMVAFLLENNRLDLDDLKCHVIDEARKFWETKLMRIIYIPDTFVYDGHVYDIVHDEKKEPYIDFKKKEVHLDMKKKSESEEIFIKLALCIAVKHDEIELTEEQLKAISKMFFRMLKMNSCFVGEQ